MSSASPPNDTAPRPAIVTTSWDDGDPLDSKLADLLSEHGLQATFYVAPRNVERAVMTREQLRELAQRFEIGSHGLMHRDLTRLQDDVLHRDIRTGKEELEGIIGAPVRMFSYPMGRQDSRIRRAVIEAGFAGARTTELLRTDLEWDAWRMPTSLFAKALPMRVWVRHCVQEGNLRGLCALLGMGPGRSWVQVACRLFERVLTRGGVWHLWGHSWEIEQHGLWGDLGEILRYVSGHDGVRYVTNGAVVSMKTDGAEQLQ